MNRPLSWAAAVAILIFCVTTMALFSGARINTTSSFPPGVYWVVDKVPEKGDLILFCPPEGQIFNMARERGYVSDGPCPGGYMRMLKRLSGVAGDRVLFQRDGVRINDVLQAHSEWLAQDPEGRSMPGPPVARIQIGSGEVLMLSDYSELSFDGRYFGPVSEAQLEEVVEPWLVWSAAKPLRGD